MVTNIQVVGPHALTWWHRFSCYLRPVIDSADMQVRRDARKAYSIVVEAFAALDGTRHADDT